MPQAIPAVIGVGASLLGAKKAKKAADADRAQQQSVIDNLANVNYDPQNIFGPMGMGFNFDDMTSSLGAFGPFQEMLGGLAESGIGQGFDIQQLAAGMGLPEMMQNFGLASGLTDQLFGDIQNFQGTQGLQDAFGGAMDFASSMFGNATAEGQGIRDMANLYGAGGAGLQSLGVDMLNRGDLARATGLDFGLGGAAGMQDIASGFFGRGNFFGDQAQSDFDSLRSSTLDTLRARDQRGEDRAAAGLADQLFGSGRLDARTGSRSGEMVQNEITDFARGLGEADLSRQLAASQEARATQAQQGNLAQMFSALGNQASGLAPAFMNAGTNLFGQGSAMDQLGLGVIGAGTSLAQLMPAMINAGTSVSGLESIPLNAFANFGQNFGQAQELENSLLNSAFDRFGSTMGLTNDLFGNMYNLGTGQLGQGTNALTSAMGMSQMPLDFARFAANLAATQSQTDINKYGGQSNVMTNFGPSGSDLMAQSLTGLGNNLFESAGGWNTIGSALGSIFKPKTDWSGVTEGYSG